MRTHHVVGVSIISAYMETVILFSNTFEIYQIIMYKYLMLT